MAKDMKEIMERISGFLPEGSDRTIVYCGKADIVPDLAGRFEKVYFKSETDRPEYENVQCCLPGDRRVPRETVDLVINFNDRSLFDDADGNFNMPCYKLGQLLKAGRYMVSVFESGTLEPEFGNKVCEAYLRAGLQDPVCTAADDLTIVSAVRARDPDEKKKEVYGIWNAWAPNYDDYHKDELATENLDLWRSVLKRVIAAPAGAKVLDIGTGTGFLSVMAAELGYDSYGIDLSEQMLDYAKKHSEERKAPVTLIRGDGDRLPFRDGTFAAVMNSRVLWTCVDPCASLREWMRVAAPGGRIISFTRTGEEVARENGMMDSMLPMSNAVTGDYVRVYQEAGLKNVTCEKLPEEMSVLAGPVWYVISGDKE